ncbi:hypothetical protein HK098_003079 [Nowakowskiella sp. JEL0407]|nr:hypothetical protein HK098_003079 [Nowakowskiella sp. JEL0407]
MKLADSDFANHLFINDLIDIGKVLPPEQFLIYLQVLNTRDAKSREGKLIIVELQVRGFLKHLNYEAKVHFQKAQLLAKEKLRRARDKLNELNRALEIFDDEFGYSLESDEEDSTEEEETIADTVTQLELERFKNNQNVAVALSNCLLKRAGMDLQKFNRYPTLILANAFRKIVLPKPFVNDPSSPSKLPSNRKNDTLTNSSDSNSHSPLSSFILTDILSPRIAATNLTPAENTPKRSDHEIYKRLFRIILASKLGFPKEACENLDDVYSDNKGFLEVATKNALHRYLLVFGHYIRVTKDEASSVDKSPDAWSEDEDYFNLPIWDIWILFCGEWKTWKELTSTLPRSLHDNSVLSGSYTENGLHPTQNLENWTSFDPFITLSTNDSTGRLNILGLPTPARHDWGKRYVCEICSWVVNEPRLARDHLWIRLKTPDGKVYSIGQYRPQKMNAYDTLVFPMKIKISKLMSPDICEFWTGPYTTISFQITKTQFEKMKTQIELDQKRGEHVYQAMHQNCVNYAMNLLALAGVYLPNKLPLIELLVRSNRVKKLGKEVYQSSYTPAFVRNLLASIWTVLINSWAVFFGAGMVDNQIKVQPKFASVEPFIRNLKDLTNPEKTITQHPYVIGMYVRKTVEEWRNEQKALLAKKLSEYEKTNEVDCEQSEAKGRESVESLRFDLENINFAMPPQFLGPEMGLDEGKVSEKEDI